MEEQRSRTVKEWRELRGMSREELAEKVGVPPWRVARWEEIGCDFHERSNEAQVMIHRLFEALDPTPGGIEGALVPSYPYWGDMVISRYVATEVLGVLRDSGLLDELTDEDGLFMVVPTAFGDDLLRPLNQLTVEDSDAITRATEDDTRIYKEKMEGAMNLIARATEHGISEDETLGEAYKRTGGFGVEDPQE